MADLPTPDAAALALGDAEASRAEFAHGFVLPSGFYGLIGLAIGVQIGTTAIGLTDVGAWGWWLLAAGAAGFVIVDAALLVRFRQLNGVWLGGLASRVIGGTAVTATVSYMLSLGAATWAAFTGLWWLVVVCAVAGGVGYAISGRRWVRAYRNEPAAHGRGESAAWTAAMAALAVAALVLLVLGR